MPVNPEGRSGKLGWPTILVVSLAHFCLFADRALPSAIAPALRQQFDLSDAQLGMLIGTAMIVPYAVATLLAGHLLGRQSPYRLMALSIVAWTAAAVAGALAGSYGELIAARIAFGLGQAAFAPAALALLATADRPASPVATSVFSTGSAAGRSGGLFIGGLLLMLAGAVATPGGMAPWRLASLWLVLPNIILAAVLFTRQRPAEPIGVAVGLGGAARHMARAPRAFIGHFAASAGTIVIAQAGGAWAPSLLNRRFGFDAAHSSIIFGLIVLAAAPIGHISAGRLAARSAFLRKGPARGMAAGAVGACLCCLILAFSSHIAMTIAALAGFVVMSGFAAATALIGLAPILESGNRLAAMSLFFATTTLVGYGVGPVITGLLSDHMGAQAHELGLALTMVVAGSAALVCLGGLWGAPSWREAAGRIA